MKPYYDHNGITIYHGDCLEILPEIEPVDLVLTDPPFPGYEDNYEWCYVDIKKVIPSKCRAFVFWKGGPFPLKYTARHIWAKANRNIGSKGEQYEEIYEISGNKTGLVLRHAVIDSVMNAQLNGDVFWPHPCQKPIKLILRLLNGIKGVVLDPFMGSGTTLLAAKKGGIRAIGIEIEEKYCEIAVRRLAQEMLPFGSNKSLETDGQKDGHRSA